MPLIPFSPSVAEGDFLPHNKVKNFFCEGNYNTARNGKETVCSLWWVVWFERETNLNDTKSEKDKTYRPDKSEDKGWKIVYNCNRVVRRKSSNTETAKKRKAKDNAYIKSESFF